MRSSAPKVITKVFVRQEKESSQRRQRVERTRIVILTLRLKIHLRVLNHDTKRINTMFHNLEKLIKLINLIILRKEVYIGLTLCPMLRLNDHWRVGNSEIFKEDRSTCFHLKTSEKTSTTVAYHNHSWVICEIEVNSKFSSYFTLSSPLVSSRTLQEVFGRKTGFISLIGWFSLRSALYLYESLRSHRSVVQTYTTRSS